MTAARDCRLAARVFAQVSGHQVVGQEPVPTMWDPAVAQQKTAALIAKYPQIDGMFSETVGPIRAFVAAGRPSSLCRTVADGSELPRRRSSRMKMMSLDAHTGWCGWLCAKRLRRRKVSTTTSRAW